ncbi:F/Y-rich N-terminus-domain-containing protein [Helicostylum pulchrum]|nr:F/Y-rich N-terminus-domain-containing protein [Helicostylum pulchrum]
MRWIKDDYFNALRNKSFEQFKSSIQTPLHPICNCYSTEEAAYPSRQIASPSSNHKETEFDRYLRQRVQQPDSNSSPPTPSSSSSRVASANVPVFRPEPIFPTSTNTTINNNNNNNEYNKHDSHIPVIYTPSNKKRKKNPIIMPAAASSTNATTTIENHASGSRTMYQKPTSQQPQQQHLQQQQQNMQQQVNTVVRTYYEVDRDNQGAYILPVEIDSWTVVDLGTVIYERPAYHNQRYIYPANYTVRKWYRSMVDPKSDTQYTCRILENGREPKFEVTADDCPMTYSGPTPTTVWTIIVRRAFAIRNQEYGHNPVGPDFFGLRKNTIAKMIQDLPNASKCSQYVWQTFEPARFNKPGRNRRRADSTLPGSLLGGVNYGLTSSRLIHNTNLTSTQHSYRANSSQSSPSSPTTTNEDESPHNHRPSIAETA